MKKDYFSQLDDYDELFCEQRICMRLVCFFVCSNSNPLISLMTFVQKGPVELFQRVKIAHSFLQSVSNLFHFIILSLPI